ncbi:glycoside hydrolase/deacetylase [Pluteus cervinus]|uniref:Glycoside hydrolase/deacetylase n=1 Tax=Pluteus cervinus TaxID=181527 RepID=A0ACD3AKD0_9AGAR|nr:glycoside hydrolase/deacetylase [Pluteus cervinus]
MLFDLATLVAIVAGVAKASPATGSSSQYPAIAPGTVITQCRVPGTAAITFDDGPHIWTSELIDSFDNAGAKTTFFINGNVYNCIYDMAPIIRKAYASGHQIASHTWSHPSLPTLNATQQDLEITRNNLAFKRILGIRPKWLRPPFGDVDTLTLDRLAAHDLKVVTWSMASDDWAGLTVEESIAKYDAIPNGTDVLALNHDPIQTTATELGPWAIQWARDRGLKVVTLSECLGETSVEDKYEFVGFPDEDDDPSTWNCA